MSNSEKIKIEKAAKRLPDAQSVHALMQVWREDPVASLALLKSAAKNHKFEGRLTEGSELLGEFNDAADIICDEINNDETLHSQVTLVWYLGVLLSHLGDKESALEYIEEVFERTGRDHVEYDLDLHTKAGNKAHYLKHAMGHPL